MGQVFVLERISPALGTVNYHNNDILLLTLNKILQLLKSIKKNLLTRLLLNVTLAKIIFKKFLKQKKSKKSVSLCYPWNTHGYL